MTKSKICKYHFDYSHLIYIFYKVLWLSFDDHTQTSECKHYVFNYRSNFFGERCRDIISHPFAFLNAYHTNLMSPRLTSAYQLGYSPLTDERVLLCIMFSLNGRTAIYVLVYSLLSQYIWLYLMNDIDDDDIVNAYIYEI